MKTKTFSTLAILMSLAAISCNKGTDNTEDLSSLTLQASCTHADITGFELTYQAGETTDSIEYAVIPAPVVNGDVIDSFKSGQIEGIKTMPVPTSPVTFPQDSIGPYIIYSRPVSAKGTRGETIVSYASASPAGVVLKDYDVIGMDLKVTIFDKDRYSKAGILVASKEILEQLGKKVEDVAPMYYNSGVVKTFGDGTEYKLELNGTPGAEYAIGVITIDHSDQIADIYSFTLKAPDADESLQLPEEMTVSASDITSNSAQIKIVKGKNTRCYYMNVLTQAKYQELLDNYSPDYYESPEAYIRDYAALYGDTHFDDFEETYSELSPDTEYVITAFPMNANGTAGYGPSSIVTFKTQSK